MPRTSPSVSRREFMPRVPQLVLALCLILAPGPRAFAQTEASDQMSRRVPPVENPAIAEAKLAVRRKDYVGAVKIWRTAAQRGNSEAAYRLGVAYRSGLGVEKSNAQAVRWLRDAAEEGHPDAAFALGVFYQNGVVVEPNRDEAIRLFGLAARGGNRAAKDHLAEIKSANPKAFALADARVAANRKDPREALNQSIRVGDTGSAAEAIARGAPVNGAPGDRTHWRPLILAIDRGDVAMAKLLLANRADPNIKSRIGEPALVLAIRSGNRALSRALLLAGASPNVSGVSGYTPLMEAARIGAKAMVGDLFRAGADPEQVLADGTSAAGIARRFGNESLAQELRSRGAPIVSGTDPEERRQVLAARNSERGDLEPSLPPVIEAARRGDIELLEEMIEQKIDLAISDPDGGNALARAALEGHAQAVSLLLEAGVDPDLPGTEGATALMRAMESASPDSGKVMERLLEAGADPHARDESGRGVIDFASKGATKRKLERVQEAGASWTASEMRAVSSEAAAAGRLPVVEALMAVTKDARVFASALCRAVEQGHDEMLQLLVAGGAPLESNCGDGHTALTIASHNGQAGIVRRLLDSGADANGNAAGRDTALIAAAGRGHLGIVDLLIEKGAEVNRRGEQRMTPLMAAATNGHPKVVEALLRAGADRGMRNVSKLRALDLARETGDLELVELIETFSPGWFGLFGAREK